MNSKRAENVIETLASKGAKRGFERGKRRKAVVRM